MKEKLTMKIMLGLLLNLLESLDQIVNEETKVATGVLKDLFVKLCGKDAASWWENLKKFLRKEACWVMTTLQRLIAAGKYDGGSSDISDQNFPIPEDFVLGADPKVYHFNRDISSEDAIREMDKDGYVPAMAWDLLDYGAKNPEEQRKYPIVGLGSVAKVGGRRRVLCLDEDGSERVLVLRWFDVDWGAHCRFLAVRKVSRPSVS